MKKFEEPEDRMGRLAAKNHPLKNLVYFVIAGITMLFLTLLVLFIANTPHHFFSQHHFPIPFIISSVLILASSFFIEQTRKNFLQENGKKLFDNLMITFVLATGFAVAQGFGWKELWDDNVTFFNVSNIQASAAMKTETGNPGGAYLFVISGLHLLHLIGGLFFLFAAIFKVVNVRSDDVRGVVYFADRLEKTRIEMLAKYWHFLGGLWMLLFICFLCFFL